MARAARYVLGLCVERSGGSFARSVLLYVPSDPVGEMLAQVARRARMRPLDGRVRDAVLSHALGPSLPAACISLLAAVAARVRSDDIT